MNRIRNIHQPYNYSFTLMYEEFPKEFLEVLGAPGKFVRKANTHVKLPGGKIGEMDASYIADPDGKTIFEHCLILLEHQRLVVRLKKGFMISNYVIQGVSDEKLPYYIAIASHQESAKHLQEYERTKSFVVRLNFIDLGERDNWERLNRIRNKLRFNKNLTLKDGLNLATAVLFIPEDCTKERTREALHYLRKAKFKSKRLEFVLYAVFYCMIDAYFEDHEEFDRMIDMLDQNASKETTEKFDSIMRIENKWENRLKNMEIELNEKNSELDEKNAEINKTNSEKETAYDFIKILLTDFVDKNDEKVKKILKSHPNILKNCKL